MLIRLTTPSKSRGKTMPSGKGAIWPKGHRRKVNWSGFKAPWRNVIHIDVATPGKHGGQPYVLTLDCGHTAFRSRGNTKDDVRSVARLLAGRLRLAPHKIRCHLCEGSSTG